MRVHSVIDSVCLYHDLQTNSWTSFLSQIFDVMHYWFCLNELYKLMESFFQIFWGKPKFFQRIKGRNIYQIAMCYISLDLSQQALQINGKFFWNSKLVFEILAANWKIFKLIERCEYWPNCNVLYINGFASTSSTNQWKAFSNFNFVFKLLAKKRKIFKPREYWSKCNILYINGFASTSSTK